MMRKKKIEINYLEFDDMKELPEQDQQLLMHAREAGKNAYAPYSEFRVGAAVLLENGEVFKGNNQENAAYPSGLCAERIALFYAASSHPGVAVKAIAVSGFNNPDSAIVKPCGACCQVLSEYENMAKFPIKVILEGSKGVEIIEGVDNLLPFGFKKSDLPFKKLHT